MVKGRPLVKEDRLNFNIYHGTSTRSLNSIRKHGFGYKDPELFDQNLLIKLAKEVEKHADVSEFWKVNEYTINMMIDKTGRFTYDKMHFSPSRFTASNYARDNEGSEYLYTIHMLLEELYKLDKGKAEEIITKCQKFKDYIKTAHQPILVVWEKPLLSQLGTEGDLSLEGVERELDAMSITNSSSLTFEEVANTLWQQSIFLSKEVLSYNEIKIEEIT